MTDPARSSLVLAVVLLVGAALGWLLRRAGRRYIAAHDRPLEPARDHLHLTMRPLADAIGLGAASLVVMAGSRVPSLADWVVTAHVVSAACLAGLAVAALCHGVGTHWVPAVAAGVLTTMTALGDRVEQVERFQEAARGVSFPLGEHRVNLLDVATSALTLVVLYAVGRFVYRAVTVVVDRQERWDKAQKLLVEKIAAIVVVAVVVLVSVDVAGLGGTVVTLFSGTLGLGLGFGLKSIFSNLVSGLLLLMDGSIKPGDTIAVDGTVGEVVSVGVRAVEVRTRDEKTYLIPNEMLVTDTVENWGFGSHDVRERVVVDVAQDSDLDLVERLLVEAAAQAPRVLTDPAPAVRITELTTNGIRHELRFWIRDPEKGRANVKHLVYRRLLDAFREHGIRMPSPGVELSTAPGTGTAFDD